MNSKKMKKITAEIKYPISIYLKPDTKKKLEKIAKKTSRKRSDIIASLVEHLHNELFPE